MSSNSSNGGGIGVIGLLGVFFVALKLTGVISWSWWLVLVPFWGGFALLILAFVVIVFIGKVDLRKRRKNAKKAAK